MESNKAFEITVKTDNAGTSASDQFTLPTSGVGYDVDWGDGMKSINQSGTITHTFPAPGTYTVKITGNLSDITFNNSGDRLKLLTIENWGGIEWGSCANAFYGCSNLVVNASDVPKTGKVKLMELMFANCKNMVDLDVSKWDISSVQQPLT